MSDKIVLIIDDTPDHISVMKAALEGNKVKAATSGEKGVAACAKAKPDLVLLDVQMPDLDGWGTLAKIRELYPASDLPVVMASSSKTAEDEARAQQAGAQGYVTKPLSPEDRDTLVKAWLS